MKILLGLIFSVQACMVSLAGEAYNTNCRQALYHILYLDFHKARTFIQNESKTNPQNIYIPYLENYIDFLNIALNEDPEAIASYPANFAKHVESIERNKDNNPDKQLLLSEIYLQSSVLHGKLNQKFTALKHLYTAEKYLAKHPGYKTNTGRVLKILPVVLLVNSYMPPFVKKMLPVSQPASDPFLILNEYRRKVTADTILTLECDILTAFLNNQFNPNVKNAYAELYPKVERSGYNPLLSLSVSLAAIRIGKSEEALHLLSKYKQRVQTPFVFCYFLTGEIKTNTDRGGEADLKYFLKNYRGKNYIKTAWLKLGWNYFVKSDTAAYLTCIKNACNMGVKWVEADIFASQEADKAQIPNRNLLKAHLLFDGGLYSQSRDLLFKEETIKLLYSTADRLEYIYRLARVDHSLGDYTLAKRYYKQVVQLGKDFPYYYAAYSALQLGIIFESESDISSAKSYYELCINMNKYGYAGSIEAKAREGLRRINH